MNLRERLLSNPSVFRVFKTLLLPRGAIERIVAEYFPVEDGCSVLDLGCGYGDYAPYFTGRCTYVGVDHSASYVAVARSRNQQSGAQFFVADVADSIVADHGPYGLIMMSGVLHHLQSDEVVALSHRIAPLLTASGRFVAIEPVFTPTQGLSARLVIASDRGRNVRDEDGYRRLLEPAFGAIEMTTVNHLLRIPYTHLVITAQR
jgi:SAM-dependent methyltransferase